MVRYEEELLSRHSKSGQKAQGGRLDPTGRRRGGVSSREQPGRMLLRPRPPPALLLPVPPAAAVLPLPLPPPVRWSKGLCVNVLWREAWWEGILLEDLSPGKARMGVYFPDEGGQNVFIIKDLQLCEQWEEERAGWSLRVHGKLPFFLLKPYSTSSPSPSSQTRSLQRPNLWKQQEAVFGAKKLIFKPIKPKTPVKIVGGPVKKKVEEEEDSSDDDEMPSSCARLQRVSRFSSCIPGRRRAVMMAPAQQPPTSPTTSSDTNTSSSSKLLQKFGYGYGQARNNTHLLSELLQQQQQQQHKRMKVQEEQQSRRRESLRSGIKQLQHEEEERQMGSRTLHHIRNSYRVVKKREEEVVLLAAAAASEGEHVGEEFVDMIIHHHQQRHHQTEKKSRGFDSVDAYSTLGSNSVGISMVLRRRQQKPHQSAQEEEEFDRFEPDVNVGMMEKNLLHKVMMHYRKRPSANMQHCSFVDTERQCSKKRRCGGGAIEAAAGPPHAVVDVLMPQLTQDEAAAGGPRGSKNHVAAVVHKGLLGVQEKIGKKKGGRGGCRMEVKLSAPVDSVHEGGSLTSMNAKKSILSWLMDLGMLAVNQKLRYVHRTRKQIALDGWVTPEGVLCSCCKMIVTLSMFEAHCGSKLHRPCANIYVEDGRTLTELQIEALKNQNPLDQLGVYSHPARTVCPGRSRSGATTKVKECAADGNDDTCGVCGDGGMLICCDHCPSTFHLTCMELQAVPEEDWFCPNCRCAVCGGPPVNANPDEFNEMTVLSCDQCEREFHLKCLYARGLPKLHCCPQGSWFCGHSCEKIFRGLRGLVGTCNPLEDGYSWTLLRSQEEDSDLSQQIDKELMAEHKIKLAIALSVMQECFKPMIDLHTKLDIVAHAIYNRGSEVSRLNYRGFYTVILEKGDELISVATVRVHGAHLAEMPLIGTRFRYRRQGMCRRLVHALELMLRMVGVQTLVLPAVPEMQDYWTGPFGFQPMEDSLKRTLLELNLLVFPGTSILQKSLAILPAALPDLQRKAHRRSKVSKLSAFYCPAVSKGRPIGGARTRQSTIRRVAGELQFVQSEVSKEHKKSPVKADSGGVLESSTECELVKVVPPATTMEEDTVSLPVADTSVDPELAVSQNHGHLSEGSLVLHSSEDDVVLFGTKNEHNVESFQQCHADFLRTEDIPHQQNGHLEDRCELKELEEDLHMVEPVVEVICCAKLLAEDALSHMERRKGCSTYSMPTDILPVGAEVGLVDAQDSVPDREVLGVTTTAELIATSVELESSLPLTTNSAPLLNLPKPSDHDKKTGYHIMDNEGRLGLEVSAFGNTVRHPEIRVTSEGGQGSDCLLQGLLNHCKDVREGSSHPTPKTGQLESAGATMWQTGDCPIQETASSYRISLARCSMDAMEGAPSTHFIQQLATSDDSMQETRSPSPVVSLAKSSADAIKGVLLTPTTRDLEIAGQSGETVLQGLQNLCEDAKEVGSATLSMQLSEMGCAMTGPATCDDPQLGSMSLSGVLAASSSESMPSTPSGMGHLDRGCAMSGQAGNNPMQELVSPSRVSSANVSKDDAATEGTFSKPSSGQLLDSSRRATTGQVGDYAVQESASPSRTSSSTNFTDQATDTVVPSTPRMGQLNIGPDATTPVQVGNNSPLLESSSPSNFPFPFSLTSASTPQQQPPSPEHQATVGEIVGLKDGLFPIPADVNRWVSEDGMKQFPAPGQQDC